MTTAKYRKWCPNKCGKSTIRDVCSSSKVKKPYACDRCKKRFTTIQIKKYNTRG